MEHLVFLLHLVLFFKENGKNLFDWFVLFLVILLLFIIIIYVIYILDLRMFFLLHLVLFFKENGKKPFDWFVLFLIIYYYLLYYLYFVDIGFDNVFSCCIWFFFSRRMERISSIVRFIFSYLLLFMLFIFCRYFFKFFWGGSFLPFLSSSSFKTHFYIVRYGHYDGGPIIFRNSSKKCRTCSRILSKESRKAHTSISSKKKSKEGFFFFFLFLFFFFLIQLCLIG